MSFQSDMNALMTGLKSRLKLKAVAKTAAYTAAVNDHVLASTSGGPWNLALPAAPALGDAVRVSDAAFTFDTNNLTVTRNGNTIAGQASNVTLRCRGQDYLFLWTGATWLPIRLSAGSWVRQDFTSSGTFTPNPLLIAAGGRVLADIVAGGGAGAPRAATNFGGGGGGGGGFFQDVRLTIVAASTVTIGAKGLGSASSAGGDTSVTHAGGTFTAKGGLAGTSTSGGPGGGGLANSGSTTAAGNTPGSGGSSYGPGGRTTGQDGQGYGGGGAGRDGASTSNGGDGYAGFVSFKWEE